MAAGELGSTIRGGFSSRATAVGSVQIEGLGKFVRELKSVDKEIAKNFVASYRVVGDLMASEVQQTANASGSKIIRKAATTIKVTANAAGVGLVLQRRGSKTPWVAAAEFGSPVVPRRVPMGAVGARNAAKNRTKKQAKERKAAIRGFRIYDGWKQFQPYKGNGPDAGYFVYPTIRANTERIKDEFVKATEPLLAEYRETATQGSGD